MLRSKEISNFMDCPRTKTPLKKVNVGSVPVFISETCGGVFLKNQSLKNFECAKSKRGKVLVEHLAQFHTELNDEAERIRCPSCIDVVMLRRYYSPLHIVEIDECPGCGGIWLDTGELAKLQSLMLNEKEKTLLRAQLLQDHSYIRIKGQPHFRDDWVNRSDKIDSLFDVVSFFTGF